MPEGRPTLYQESFIAKVDERFCMEIDKNATLVLPHTANVRELLDEYSGREFKNETSLINHFNQNIATYFSFLTGGDMIAGIERELTIPRGFPRGYSVGRMDMLITGISGDKYVFEFKNKVRKNTKNGKSQYFGYSAQGVVQAMVYTMLLEEAQESIKHTFLIAGTYDAVIPRFLTKYSLPISYCLLRPGVISKVFK